MGSTGSKPSTATSSSSSSSSSLRIRHKGRRIFQSSCLACSSRSHDSDNDGDQVCSNQNKESEAYAPSANQTGTETDQTKIDNYRGVKLDHQSVEIPSLSSYIHLNEWDRARVPNSSSTQTGSSSAQDSSTQSLNPSSNFLSRFSFIPGNVSFRLSRATSLGSSRSFPVSSTSPTSMLNNEDELHSHRQPSTSVLPIDEALPSSNHYGCTSASFSNMARECDNNNIRVGSDVNLYPPRINAESNETRLPDRRIGDREPVERIVRFSWTLSVGRLRDRVLRRSSLSDFTFCPLQQESEEREGGSQIDQTRVVVAPEENNNTSHSNTMTSPTRLVYPPPSLSNSLFGIQDYEGETNQPREARYQDLHEHRSNFLERRRRIRSQVRALQRLGSRFENLSGHERSCILSGQHRTGRCTCRINTRDDNINDNNGARASISRIVMLAEALFEVLDEIHQQSAVLTARPSISSIGSLPAPTEAVESLPVKLYSKLKKHETDEIPQCYICLVEYEEGDDMRILPCHHEFHRTCVDKWLKEIHRVCPLCRRDICRSEPLSVEN